MGVTIGCAVAAEHIRHFRPRAGHRLEKSEVLWWCRSWFNGNRTRQQVQRTGCRADLVGRDTQVLGRGGEAAMTEEELNGPEIGTGFEEMHSKCVPKRMRRDGFYEAGETMRLLAGCFNGVLRDRPIAATAREQPFFRADGSPVAAQNLQQHRRQHHVPIFAAFALRDANDHLALSMATALRRTASEMRKPAA